MNRTFFRTHSTYVKMWKVNLNSSLFSNHSIYWTFDDLHPQDTQTQNLKEVEVGYGGYRVLVNSSSSEKKEHFILEQRSSATK